MIEELMPAGFEFYGAADGVEALEFIASCKFDVIILDIDMPRLNGIELLRAARGRNVNTPVILYTGESRPKRIREFLKLGIDDFVLKPCDRDFLREKIVFVATQRSVQVDEEPVPSVGGSTTMAPAPTIDAPPTTAAPAAPPPPGVVSPPAAKSDELGYFVVQQVRYPSRIFMVTKNDTILGRGGSADLKLVDGSVSRQHAKLTFDDGIFTLEDFGSSNGTFVNDTQITKQTLKLDDQIKIGDFFLLFKPLCTQGQKELENLQWMESYSVSDKEAAQEGDGFTRMLSPEAIQDAMQHVSLRNSTVLVRDDDQTAYELGEMLFTFGAGGIPCEGVQGPADVHIYWDGEAHRIRKVSPEAVQVRINQKELSNKALELGDIITVGNSIFYYKIGS